MSLVSQRLRDLSLAHKLTAIGVATSSAAIIVTCAAIVMYDVATSQTRLVRDVGLLADVLGANSTAALAFGDAHAANETLGAVAVNTHIVSAALLLPQGQLFARYQRDPRSENSGPAADPEAVRQHQSWQ